MSIVSSENLKDTLGKFKDNIDSSLNELSTKVNRIDYTSKIIDNGSIDYLYMTNGVTSGASLSMNTNILTKFTEVTSHNIEYTDNAIHLDKGYQYKVTVSISTSTRNGAYFITLKGMTIGNNDYAVPTTVFGNRGYMSNNDYGNGPIEAIITAKEDMDIIVISDRTSNFYPTDSFVLVEKINTMGVDPIAYINTSRGMEDAPVGTIHEMLNSEGVRKGYLPMDGREIQVGTYPYFEQYLVDNYGSVNCFGGDGVNNYTLPNNSAPEEINIPVMTSNNSSIVKLAVSSEYPSSTNYKAWMMYDTNIEGTWWENRANGEPSCWITYDFGKEIIFNAMSAYSRNSDYSPKSAVVFTSTNGNNWTERETIVFDYTGDTTLHNSNITKLSNRYNTRYLKLVLQGQVNGTGGSKLIINKLSFYNIHPTGLIKVEPTYFMTINTSLQNNYSADEQQIGYWIDGKPLYQNTIIFDNRVTANTNIDLSYLNIDNMINYTCYCGNNDNTDIWNNNHAGDTSQQVFFRRANQTLNYRSTYSGYYMSGVTIQYTKKN